MAAVPAESRYSWRLLRAGALALDGGSMFGVVPRALWSRLVSPDEQGRIALAHNCLLLESLDSPSPTRILIETGSGDKLSSKMRRIFGLTDYTIASALAEHSIPPDSINHVILSHLHFDHAGGVTRRALAGETPDWIPPEGPSEESPAIKLTFPNATIHVQRREWEDALTNRSAMTRTYLPDHLHPIRERIRLLDAPPPFPPGYLPQRDELPISTLADRQIQILPGIGAFNIPGHTWGQQAIRFTDAAGQNIVFSADLIPTAHHVGAAYNMAYDVEPFTSTVTRRWFLQAALEGDWLLVLDHEPSHPLQRVRADGKGWFTLIPAKP